MLCYCYVNVDVIVNVIANVMLCPYRARNKRLEKIALDMVCFIICTHQILLG
jgi:hypothetical protein